jgi:uncharacterized protein (DUF885 family)
MRRTLVFLTIFLLGGVALPAADLEAQRAELDESLKAIEENSDGLGEAERLQAFIDLYFEYAMLEFPEFATMIGHPVGHDRWTDNSFEAQERREKDTVRGLAALQTISRDKLEGADRLNYDLLVQDMKDDIEGQRFQGELMAINQMGGVHQNTARMLAMMPATSVEQYENILARLNGIPTLVDQTLARLEKGLEAGVTPPKVTLRDVPQQVENLLVEDPLQSPMLMAFAEFPESIPEQDQERLRAEAVEVFQKKIAPAYEKLHTYLTETYIPGTRESIGMNDLPDGEAWYAYNVKQMTTTDMTPEEIHELGLSEVKRIRGQMDQVIAGVEFEGDFKAFTDFLRHDEQFFFDDAEELLRTYRDISKRADAELVKLFGTLPRLPYGVVPVPAYAEKSQTTAYYQPGSLKAGRPGEFFANTYDLKSRPSWEMEALTLHEAVPGHHLQIALAQELDELPWFRRFGGYTAYVEGWGLYSESLGEEMGFYEDPYAKFGQLTYEMWRAIRLVVDTGMHHLGWTRQQAIDFFNENVGKAEHDIVVEVDRYIVWPGQALAYKIGELKIKELRARATKELGDQFDIRAFHDEILGNGALPLTVLELHMGAWIDAQKEEARMAAAGGEGR